MTALDGVGKIWTLPNTVIGVMYGGLGHLFGKLGNLMGRYGPEPHISFGNNAIQFENNPLVATAITIGNVIVYGHGKHYQPNAPRCGGAHALGIEEMQHTFQAQILGPLYLPAHCILGVAAKLLNGYWHGPINVLEAGPHEQKPRLWKYTGSWRKTVRSTLCSRHTTRRRNGTRR
jgi:hypothetical protein